MKSWLTATLLAAALVACAPPATKTEAPAPLPTPATTPVATEAPSGAYKLDPTHATLLFRVKHLGFSNYTGRFTKFDAKLNLDTADPTKSTLEASVDANSLALENPPAGFVNEIKGWLGVAKAPLWTFRSRTVELTGPDTARISGDFTMNGVTKPVALDARFNGGYPGHPMDPNARIGFSATGELKRSEFGVAQGIPAPGSTMGVSDAVEIILEAEFTGPPLATATPEKKS
jgi:polyisoprenoid-binding protein YceI